MVNLSFGVSGGPHSVPIQEMLTFWSELEDWGADAISVGDHLVAPSFLPPDTPQYEAVALLTALAMVTERPRIGCLVFAAPFRNPGLLSKSLTTIDHLSGGRLDVGLGAGWDKAEFDAFGYFFGTPGTRLTQLEESARVLRRSFRHNPAPAPNTTSTSAGDNPQPRPIQHPLPIWIGGTGERRTLRLVARYADGWNANGVSPSEYRRLNGVLDDWCRTEGRPPNDIIRSVNLQFSIGADDATPNRYANGTGALSGTLDDAEQTLIQYIEAGATRVNVLIRKGWDLGPLEAYFTEVVPRVKATSGS